MDALTAKVTERAKDILSGCDPIEKAVNYASEEILGCKVTPEEAKKKEEAKAAEKAKPQEKPKEQP